MKKIAIIGLGGVGGYFGFKLAECYAQSNEVEMTFIARGETFEIVKKNGLTLLSPEHANTVARPKNIFRDPGELAEPAVIIIAVKEYDLENVCLKLKGVVKKETVLLPLMNGVDIYERIRRVIPQGIVLPSCLYVASHLKGKGVVEHKGNPGKIITGKDPQHPAYDAQWLVELLKKAAIHVEYKDNSFPDIWTKFFFIASFGLVSARYNKSIGQINEDVYLHERAASIMKEIENIARKKEVTLPPNVIAQTFEKAATFPYQTPTSLQLDVQSGKEKNELELFAGAIISYGKTWGIPVIATQQIYNEIKEGISVA